MTAAEAVAADKLPARRARLARPRELWGRRTVAIGTVLVAAAVIGGIVLLLVGSGDDNGSSGPSRDQVKNLQNELLDKTVVNPTAGISVRRPSSWSDSKRGNAIVLSSEDRCVSMTLAAPTAANQWRKLAQGAIDSLKTQENVTFSKAGNSSLGGIPTTSFRASLTTAKGAGVRTVISVGKGKKYAYLTETALGNPKCRQDLAAAQVILTSVEYTK
jgi:hypothetical protein